jgi:ankyrin repeat protein
MIVSTKGFLSIFDKLIAYGANFNQQNSECQNTALIRASKSNCLSAVDHLVGLGCDLNLRDFEGKTALMWACY